MGKVKKVKKIVKVKREKVVESQEDRFDSKSVVMSESDLEKLNAMFSVVDETEIDNIIAGNVGIDDW